MTDNNNNNNNNNNDNSKNDKKVRGRIKSLKKNYGFIGATDGNDYFFYWTYLNEKTKTFKSLSVGDTVEFSPEILEDKFRAKNIIALD